MCMNSDSEKEDTSMNENTTAPRDDELVEFTREGFDKAAAALDFLPEDQRAMWLNMTIGNLIFQ